MNLSIDTHYSPVDMNDGAGHIAFNCSHCVTPQRSPLYSNIFVLGAHKRGSNDEAESVRYGPTRGDTLRKSLHDMKKEWGLGVRPLLSEFLFIHV